jgi:hypothetical protein
MIKSNYNKIKNIHRKRIFMKRRIFLFLSIFLLLFGLILPYETKDGFCLGDSLLHQLGLPAWYNDKSHTGLHLTVLYALVILILGWAGVKRFANRKIPIGRILVLIIILPTLFELGRGFVMGLYGDLRSIGYISKDSYCEVIQLSEAPADQRNSAKLYCHIGLINYSGKSLPFRLKLPKGQLVPQGHLVPQYFKLNHEDAPPQDIELTHDDAPYETIDAHSEDWIDFEKQLSPQAVGIRHDYTRNAPTLVLFNDHQSITLAGY